MEDLSFQAIEERWNGRRAVRVTNGVIEAVVLPGGGHIAELRLAQGAGPSVNCLWSAPWQTTDPDDAEFMDLARTYGGEPAGRYMAAYTGHSLCLDAFGNPSPADAAHGIPLHGEAAVQNWHVEIAPDALMMRVHLPVARVDCERMLRVDSRGSVLLVEETVCNLRPEAREIHWVEHVSLGSPFLDPGSTTISASLDQGLTWPLGYDGRGLFPDNMAFEWPVALSPDHGPINLEIPFEHPGTGFVAGVRVRPDCRVAFLAVRNRALGLALVYCFRRSDFPWIAVWEENHARRFAPWSSRAQVRGMEFGTTPLPLGRDAIRNMGPLFETPVSRTLPGRGVFSVHYAACLVKIPLKWDSIVGVEADSSGLTLIGPRSDDRVEMAGANAGRFLMEESPRTS